MKRKYQRDEPETEWQKLTTIWMPGYSVCRRLCIANTLNLSLTDELRAFVDQNCGDGTLYATPSEYVRDLVRQRKLQLDSAAACDSILAGYQNVGAGRTVTFEGDLRSLLKNAGK